MIRFNIGDTVYWATYQRREEWIPCPDCGGTRRVRVILHDNDEQSIDCATCSRGYEPPTGKVVTWEFSKAVSKGTILGVEISAGRTEWRVSPHYIVKDVEVFTTEEDALLRAEELAVEANEEEQRRIAQKEKPNRSWAWSASYHRREIKECERRISYHKAKLNVAAAKAKGGDA